MRSTSRPFGPLAARVDRGLPPKIWYCSWAIRVWDRCSPSQTNLALAVDSGASGRNSSGFTAAMLT
jgi:hypothetical protein